MPESTSSVTSPFTASATIGSARAVATGGTGADTFLISAARPADKFAALLGVVLDYSAAKGDHLAVMGEGRATVVSTAAVSRSLRHHSTPVK